MKLRKTFLLKAPIVLLTISLVGNSFAKASTDVDMKCYIPEERQKISEALVGFELCQVDLAAKNDLLKKTMLDINQLSEGKSFWQDPTFVWGGLVVSFAAGSLITFLALKK